MTDQQPHWTRRSLLKRGALASTAAAVPLVGQSAQARYTRPYGSGSKWVFDECDGGTKAETDSQVVSWAASINGPDSDDDYPGGSAAPFYLGLSGAFGEGHYSENNGWTSGDRYGQPGRVEITIEPSDRPHGANPHGITDVDLFVDGGGEIRPDTGSADMIEWGAGYVISLVNAVSPLPIPDVTGLASGPSRPYSTGLPNGGEKIVFPDGTWENTIGTRFYVDHGGETTGNYELDVTVDYQIEYFCTVGATGTHNYDQTREMTVSYDLTEPDW